MSAGARGLRPSSPDDRAPSAASSSLVDLSRSPLSLRSSPTISTALAGRALASPSTSISDSLASGASINPPNAASPSIYSMNGVAPNTVSSPGPNGPAGAGVDLSLEALAEHFHLPIAEAARQIGVCATVLKKICRKYVLIPTFPHRITTPRPEIDLFRFAPFQPFRTPLSMLPFRIASRSKHILVSLLRYWAGRDISPSLPIRGKGFGKVVTDFASPVLLSSRSESVTIDLRP